jgi:hypothetical protein
MPESNDDKRPRPVSARPAPAPPAGDRPGLRGQRERPRAKGPRRGRGKAGEGKRRPGAGASPPVSAREGIHGAPPAPSRLTSFPARTFEVDGTEWIARETGWTTIGSQGSSTAALLHLSFSKGEGPEDVVVETLTTGDSLEALSVEALVTLLSNARTSTSSEPPSQRPELG